MLGSEVYLSMQRSVREQDGHTQERGMKQIDVREGAKRQHRTIALFAVIQCWLRDLDGLVFSRQTLERLIGIERFKGSRVAWLIEDLTEFFPHYFDLYFAGKQNSLFSLYVSRKEFAPYFPGGTMGDEQRIAGITAAGG